MENNNKWMVCVQCMTYNQAPYIVDALNGFTMQETTFPFVCCIIDDASTDGEPEIIDRYMEVHFDLDDVSSARREETDDYSMLFARHKTNKNCYFAVLFLKYNHYSSFEIKMRKLRYISRWLENAKYIAVCEGDDYWIDPRKMQKQVDFLEKDQDYGLVRTNINRLHQADGIMEKRFCSGSKMKDTHSDYIYNSWFAAPCTWLYRNKYFQLILEEKAKITKIGGFSGDLASILTISKYSKIKYLDEVTAVYRILDKSASHFESEIQWKLFQKKLYITRRYFADKQSVFTRIKLEFFIAYKELRVFIHKNKERFLKIIKL